MFLFSLLLNAPINGKKTWPCLRFFMLRCIFITKKKNAAFRRQRTLPPATGGAVAY